MKKSAQKNTLTELLRTCLKESKSLYAVAQATGLQNSSLMRFQRGDQFLRSDKADKLCEYFGITFTRKAK